MANIKVSDLPSTDSLLDADLFLVTQLGQSKRVSFLDLRENVDSSISVQHPSRTFAATLAVLNSQPPQYLVEGAFAYCTDGRKYGQEPGQGTGMMVYWGLVAPGAYYWLTFLDNSIITV